MGKEAIIFQERQSKVEHPVQECTESDHFETIDELEVAKFLYGKVLGTEGIIYERGTEVYSQRGDGSSTNASV